MRFENDGITIWHGTPDAPAPGSIAQRDSKALVIGVKPIDASNTVSVDYRVNGGVAKQVVASWLRNESQTQSQYFLADLGNFHPGDTVKYQVKCTCAGRTVPKLGLSEQQASTFLYLRSISDTAQASKQNLQSPSQTSARRQSGEGKSEAIAKGSPVGNVSTDSDKLFSPYYSYAAEWWKSASSIYLDILLRKW